MFDGFLWLASYRIFYFSIAFWQLAYDLGLGFLLYSQSNYFWFEKVYNELYKSKSKMSYLVKLLTYSSIDDIQLVEKAPTAFKSWLAFSTVVDYILQRLMFYPTTMVLFYYVPHLNFADNSTLYKFIVGLAICLYSVWVKIDALRVAGVYAWYWGDFFFTVKRDLVFDGVYKYFPHPMYTVGYFHYYGLALIASSWTLFFFSLLIHSLQLLFLFFIEIPHMDKIYKE